MTWTPVVPDGSISVAANEANMLANTAYIKTTMGGTANDTTNTASIRDHYWHVGANFDGRHRFINSPAYTISGSPADPVIGTGMGGVSYFKTLSSAESPGNQDVQPYFRNAGGIMQILALRAAICFTLTPNAVLANAPTVASTDYAINASVDVTNMTKALTREFTVNFATNLPSINYFVQGDCVAKSGTSFFRITPTPSATVGDTKKVGSIKLNARPDGTDVGPPLQVWVYVFGG